MKTTKRLLSCLLVLAMLFALAIPAFAVEGDPEPTDTPADGTIVIENAIRGGSYKAVKVFSASIASDRTSGANDGIAYSGDIPTELDSFFKKVNGQVLLKDDVDKTAVVDAVTAWAADKDGQTGSYDDNKNTYTITGLEPGYYAVVSSEGLGGAVTITSINPGIVVYDKNESDGPHTPGNDPLKKIDVKALEGVTLADTDKKVTVDAGTAVPFVIAFEGANYKYNDETKKNELIYQYEVVDIPTNMTIDWNSVEVTVAGVPNPLVKGTDYTIDGNTVIIKWADPQNENAVNSLYAHNALVTIKYTATLTDNTKNGSNTAKVNYNNGKSGIEQPDPKDDPKVYSTTISIDKYEDGNTNKKLTGAKFVLYRLDENENKEYYSIAAGTVSWGEAKTEVETKDGAATFVGLKDGTYYLEETAAPSGYNRMETAQKVVINEDTTTEHTVVATAEVPNARGTQLPSTGGIGTTMFYVIGGILVAAAVVVLVSKKRMGAEQ